MKLGKRLRQLLEERELTQRDLAKRFGWGESTVAHWVAGSREPDLDTVEVLADFFGVTIDYLLGRTNTRTAILTPSIPDSWEETIRRLTEQGLSADDVQAAIDFIRAAKKMREG